MSVLRISTIAARRAVCVKIQRGRLIALVKQGLLEMDTTVQVLFVKLANGAG